MFRDNGRAVNRSYSMEFGMDLLSNNFLQCFDFFGQKHLPFMYQHDGTTSTELSFSNATTDHICNKSIFTTLT